jgi:integrase
VDTRGDEIGSENLPKITKEFIDRSGPGSFVDSDLPGFGLDVGNSGVRTFFIRYRPKGTGRGGPRRYVKIGRYGIITPVEARNEARRILGRVAAGEDPAAEAAEARNAITVAELAQRFLEDEIAPKRARGTLRQYKQYLKHALPEIGRMKAEAVTRAVVAKLHVKIGKSHPVTANRTLTMLSTMFAFGAARGLLPGDAANPASRIEKFRESGRERFLTAEEFERLGAALREAETVGVPWQVDENSPNVKHVPKERRFTVVSPFATAAIRLLIFTGCRLREILDLEWRFADFERGLLNLPTSKTGKKSVTLNAPALEILVALPRLGAYVIPGDNPARPRADLKRPWDVICRRAGLEGLRLHDLRHSFASVGAGAGLGLPVIGKLLGHASPATTSRYAHLDADPVRKATNAIGATIAAAMGGKSGDNVVTLAKAPRDE